MSNQTRPSRPVRPPRACIPALPAVSPTLTPTLQGHLPGEPRMGGWTAAGGSPGAARRWGRPKPPRAVGAGVGEEAGRPGARPLGKLGGRPVCRGSAAGLWRQTPHPSSTGRAPPLPDINECLQLPPACAYQCRNLQGGYRCLCPPGHTLLPDGKACTPLERGAQNVTTVSHSGPSVPRLRPRAPISSGSYHAWGSLRPGPGALSSAGRAWCPTGFIRQNGVCTGKVKLQPPQGPPAVLSRGPGDVAELRPNPGPCLRNPVFLWTCNLCTLRSRQNWEALTLQRGRVGSAPHSF